MFVKMGYPGWGWATPRARLGCRLPPHLPAPTRWKKNQKDRASFFFTNSKTFVKMARLARMRIMACRATLRCVGQDKPSSKLKARLSVGEFRISHVRITFGRGVVER